MAATPDGLGRLFNVVKTASGANIKLVDGTAATFVFGDPGTGAAIATVTQTDSTGVNAEIALNIFNQTPENLGSRAHVGPDTGGTWLEDGAAVFTANTFDLSDETTNDTGVFTVRAEQLADGYDSVQVTVDTGTCFAILHDLTVQRKPSNLRSPLGA